jgi:hypothetical protein
LEEKEVKYNGYLTAAFLIFVLAITAGATPVTTLTFQSHSSATNTADDSIWVDKGDGSVLAIPANSAWYSMPGVPWISHWQSGAHNAEYFQVPNGTVQEFTQTFTLPAGFMVTSATLKLLADDTASATLNGQLAVSPTDTNPAEHCVLGTPGCVSSTMFSGSLNPAWFQSGTNVLKITSFQLFGDSNGIASELQVTGSQVPEPATYGTATLGLFLVGLIARRQRNSRS